MWNILSESVLKHILSYNDGLRKIHAVAFKPVIEEISRLNDKNACIKCMIARDCSITTLRPVKVYTRTFYCDNTEVLVALPICKTHSESYGNPIGYTDTVHGDDGILNKMINGTVNESCYLKVESLLFGDVCLEYKSRYKLFQVVHPGKNLIVSDDIFGRRLLDIILPGYKEVYCEAFGIVNPLW